MGIATLGAQSRILENRAPFVRRKEVNKAFKAADNQVAEGFPGMSNGERRLVAIAIMIEIIAPVPKSSS